MLRAAERNSLTTRITHWGTAIAFVLLFASGAAIYNHRPSFRFGHATLVLPRIPAWLSITAAPKIVHYVLAAVFVLCGACYLIWGVRSGHFNAMMKSAEDARNVVPMQLYYLRLRKTPPPYAAYNPLQKLAYVTVLFVIAPLIAITGTAMLPIEALHPLGAVFPGGVKFWHFVLVGLLCIFVLGHLMMVLATGFRRNLQKMI